MNTNTEKLHDLSQRLWLHDMIIEMLVKGTLARRHELRSQLVGTGT